ncbi:MAG: hypothetical protein KIT49_09345 [Nitrospira sp.]|jgi:hypothetical protein|nr:hypothetical protein [Nitrospira sp.]
MTTLWSVGIACVLLVTLSFTACAPPTPKVEPSGPSSIVEPESRSSADSTGSLRR